MYKEKINMESVIKFARFLSFVQSIKGVWKSE